MTSVRTAMVRRIKPVSRPLKKETEVRRRDTARPARRRILPDLGEIGFPAVDVYERAEAVIVEVELAGVSETDIQVLLHPGRVEVSGFKREMPAHAGSRYLRLEREFGAFRREVVVPSAVDPDRTCAFLENGVLTVVLPKLARPSRDVDIKSRRRED